MLRQERARDNGLRAQDKYCLCCRAWQGLRGACALAQSHLNSLTFISSMQSSFMGGVLGRDSAARAGQNASDPRPPRDFVDLRSPSSSPPSCGDGVVNLCSPPCAPRVVDLTSPPRQTQGLNQARCTSCQI